MITVVFHIDLTHLVPGSRCTSDESNAFQALQVSIKSGGLQSSSIAMGVEVIAVAGLPKNESSFGDLVSACNRGRFPYRTLWLNDVAEWRKGGHSDKN